jgi:histidinol-phosphate/aromatic aminotransferase/cobyric acid decarboxylase-like protein
MDERARLAVHGGLTASELERFGLQWADVVDFSASTNPFGPCPEVAAAIARSKLDTYPDPDCTLARSALAATLSRPVESILVGNGAAELIWTAVQTLCAPGSTAVVVEPAFSEFRRACLATGVRVDEWRTTPAAHFRLDLDEVRNRLTTVGASAAYLCAPSSPSGVGVAAPAIATLCASMPEIAFIVDQSFLSLSERHRDATAPLPDNALVVRSLTKDHGIPGARVGYAFGRSRWVAAMSARRPPWTVNAFAQSAVAAAVERTSFVERTRRRLLDDRRRLQRQL